MGADELVDCSLDTCVNLATDAGESDVDCGGPLCDPCGAESSCRKGGDCKGGLCVAETCLATCNDDEQNGTETDVDCGGSCNRCPNDDSCSAWSDCDSYFCDSGTCTACTEHADCPSGAPLCVVGQCKVTSDLWLHAAAAEDSVALRWTDPRQLGQAVTSAQVHVRKKAVSCPTDIADGELVYQGSNTTAEDDSLTDGDQLCYRIWIDDGASGWENPPAGSTNEMTVTVGTGWASAIWHNQSDGALAEWHLAGGGGLKSYGTISTKGTPSISSAAWQIQALVDIDDDGFDDILWRNTTTGGVYHWLLASDGTMASSGTVFTTVDTSWSIEAVGSCDQGGEHYTNVAWRHSSGSFAMWRLDTDGEIALVSDYGIGQVATAWKLRAMADLDADGCDDMLWQHSSTGGAAAWLVNEDETVTTGYVKDSSDNELSNLGANWQILTTGDIDGDAYPDVLWKNTADGKIYYWLLTYDAGNDEVELKSGGSGLVLDANTTGWSVVGFKDLNDDGVDDIVWRADSGDCGVAFWPLQSDGSLDTQTGVTTIYNQVAPDWRLVGIVSYEQLAGGGGGGSFAGPGGSPVSEPEVERQSVNATRQSAPVVKRAEPTPERQVAEPAEHDSDEMSPPSRATNPIVRRR